MRTWNDLYKMLKNGEMDQSLIQTGCEDINAYRTRATEVMNGFEKTFGVKRGYFGSIVFCSGTYGNVWESYRSSAWTCSGGSSESGFPCMCVTEWDSDCSLPVKRLADDDSRSVRSKAAGSRKETTASLVRGVMAELAKAGYTIGGFDMYAVSNVLPGSGLSSSAACEILLGVAGNHLFCQDELDAVTLAKIGQKAENQYFGKPSGLMDQTASSCGRCSGY